MCNLSSYFLGGFRLFIQFPGFLRFVYPIFTDFVVTLRSMKTKLPLVRRFRTRRVMLRRTTLLLGEDAARNHARQGGFPASVQYLPTPVLIFGASERGEHDLLGGGDVFRAMDMGKPAGLKHRRIFQA
jgi:hypothetical protein